MDPKLLDILVCPVCKANLDYQKETSALVCKPCKLSYPIREGIPIMLVDEAQELCDDAN